MGLVILAMVGAAVLVSLLLFALWMVLLVRTFKARARRPKTFRFVIALSVLLVAGSLTSWASDLASSAWERRYWASVDRAARVGNLAQARKLLAGRPGGFQSYVERGIEDETAVDAALASAAFAACADLLDDRPEPSYLLGKAITAGSFNLIRLWLEQPECGRAGTASRSDRLVASVKDLLPSSVDSAMPVAEADALRTRQAAALREILEHHPALFDVEIIDPRCSRDDDLIGFPRCTLLSQAFSQQQAELLRVLLPLDRRAQAHLQDLAWNTLRGNAARAAESARKSPAVLLALLPDLLATAPFGSLKAAVQAAALDESALLARDNGPLRMFRAAFQQDARSPGWPRLNLMLDQWPTRLQEVEPQAFHDYIATGDTAASAALMARLHGAGMACDRLAQLAQAWPRSPIDLPAPGSCAFGRAVPPPFSAGHS